MLAPPHHFYWKNLRKISLHGQNKQENWFQKVTVVKGQTLIYSLKDLSGCETDSKWN